MCSKPEPPEHYQVLSNLVEALREESLAYEGRMALTHPAHDYGWAGVRTFYGLLENV